jgi:hypothetical protein
MTQVDLNDVEIYMILRCIKEVRTVLDTRPLLPGLESKEHELETRSRELQSIAYKLEKYVKDYEPYEL